MSTEQPPRRGAWGIIIVATLAALFLVPQVDESWKVIILGVVEGLTEFLPISSTGHLLVVSDALGYAGSLGGTFEIFIQLGAVVSVVGYYGRDLLAQVRAVRHDGATQRLWFAIALAFLPAALVGIMLRGPIKALLFNPQTIAIALIVGGVALIIIERRPPRRVSARALTDVTPRQAVLIGVAQVLALVPGVSRAGASIVGGLLLGLDRTTATAFSFYLAIPTLGLATIVDLLLSLDEVSAAAAPSLALGALVSGIVAWFTIGWLLRYVASRSFVGFGIYRIVAGLVILLLLAGGML
jgi:undecaprenyl-diphosphatase